MEGMKKVIFSLVVVVGLLNGCTQATEEVRQPTPVKELDDLEKLEKLTGSFLDIPEPLTENAAVVEQDIISYSVAGDRLGTSKILSEDKEYEEFSSKKEQHAHLWALITSVIPLENRGMVKEFVLFTDGMDSTLGFVSPLQTNTAHWRLAIDFQDTSNLKDFYYTLVHEFGHLLTLNQREVPPSSSIGADDNLVEEAMRTCETYYALQGCSNADSYIYDFYKEFWTNRYDEWLEMDVASTETAQREFFDRYIDDFLTVYAVSHPEEDIADSWAHFIFSKKPVNPTTVAQRKIAFFYNYPELVELRKMVLKNLYDVLK